MAEMAARVANASAADAGLIRAAAGLLLLVFCAKAALLPLYLWLPNAYARAPAAVAALFAIMTKVGVYAVLRVYTLVFGSHAGALAGWAWDWLLPAGAITLVLATLGALAASTMRMQVAYLVIASAATLFIAFALATPASVASGLYYLLHSTFITAALFLVVDLIGQQRGHSGDQLDYAGPLRHAAPLGLLFGLAAVSVVGLPPLSGFIGKLMLLDAVPAPARGWLWAVVLVTSLMALSALARTGSQVFWRAQSWPAGIALPPAPQRLQLAAAALLIGYGFGLVLAGGRVVAYTQATAQQLLQPAAYIQAAHDTVPQRRAPSP
jgi:multicomponent K+:H+ antiporter subunit D